MIKAQRQAKRQTEHLKPWQFQPGKSGNPGGMKKGTKSLKTFAREYLMSLSDDKQKLEYLRGMDKDTIWKMAEGNPINETELKGNLTISQVLDNLENGSKTSEQNVEAEQPIQDKE